MSSRHTWRLARPVRCQTALDFWRVSVKIDTPRLHSVRWHLTTVGSIAKWMEDFQL